LGLIGARVLDGVSQSAAAGQQQHAPGRAALLNRPRPHHVGAATAAPGEPASLSLATYNSEDVGVVQFVSQARMHWASGWHQE
jgi:hypothetical protein